MFVNYKNFFHKSRDDAPSLDDIMEELHVNSTMCFPVGEDNEDIADYVERLIGYLHADMEVSSRSSSSSGSPKLKRTKRGLTIQGVRFKTKTVDHLEKLQNRWELFVLLTGKRVDASCLVKFNDIYQTCEIHEVCVATPGQGYCKILLSSVLQHIQSGASGKLREVSIFCDSANTPACKCYANVFDNAVVVRTPHTVAYTYRLRKRKSSA